MVEHEVVGPYLVRRTGGLRARSRHSDEAFSRPLARHLQGREDNHADLPGIEAGRFQIVSEPAGGQLKVRRRSGLEQHELPAGLHQRDVGLGAPAAVAMGCSFAGLVKARLLIHIRKGCTPPNSQQVYCKTSPNGRQNVVKL